MQKFKYQLVQIIRLLRNKSIKPTHIYIYINLTLFSLKNKIIAN